MKINSFKAEGVHDYLNFDIQFYGELTFLIGINGSGKTSALKLILGLTSPSYNYLNQINYKYCEVICSSNSDEMDIKIRAEQVKNGEAFKIEFINNNEIIVSEPMSRFLRNEEPFDIEEFSLTEQRHREYFDNLDITKKLEKSLHRNFWV